MIVLEPFGGLGNRIRAMASAIQLARKTNHSLRIDWIPDDSIRARFRSLFSPVANVKLEELGNETKTGALVGTLIFRFFRKLRTILSLPHAKAEQFDASFTQDDVDAIGWNPEKWLNIARDNRTVHIRSYSQFFEIADSIGEILPEPRLLRKIDRLSARLHLDRCIAVHVRRGDNVLSRELSPIEAFLDILRSEGSTGERDIFLATDDSETEVLMRREFGARLKTYQKRSLRRDSRLGIQEALVELYLLSRCSRIVGSSNSSFSEMASALGNIGHQVAERKSHKTASSD